MRAIFFACLLTCAASAVRADLVVMRNGDRISGEVLAMAEGRLVVRTAYAGEITLEWSVIESLESDRPLAVMLQGEPAPVLCAQPPALWRWRTHGARGSVSLPALGKVEHRAASPRIPRCSSA